MKKNFKYKPLVAAGLSLALVLGGSTAVYADHHAPGHHKKDNKWNNGNKNGKGNQKNKGNNHKKNNASKRIKANVKLDFRDLEGLDWARKHIANLAAMHIFEGYDDGTFRPNKPVTRLEAVITAVRLMDLRDEAEDKRNSNLNFKDASQIERKYPQAVGYVAVAAENNLFIETEDQLQPEKPATRLWVATMLVKAMGLEEEALKKMNTQLKFKDADAIPAGSVGYVAIAAEKGIVFGYNNGTFQPNKPVTRAEIAAFLDRTGQHLPDFNKNTYSGELLNVWNDELLLSQEGKVVTIPIDSGVFVYRDGKQVRVSDLVRGDELFIRTYDGEAIFIEVVKGASNGKDSDKDYSDAFAATVSSIDVKDEEITLIRDGRRKTYEIDDDAVIRLWNGKNGNLSSIRNGSEVFVRIDDDEITFIHVLDYAMFDFEGKLVALPDKDTLIIQRNGEVEEYVLADRVRIIRDNVEIEPSDLVIQDTLEVQIRDGEIVWIDVKESAEFNQTLSAVMAAAISDDRITVKTKTSTLQYELADNVFVQKDRVKLELDDLRVGDEIELRIFHNRVVGIEVVDAANANISFESIVKEKVTKGELTVTLDGLTLQYPLSDDVQIYRNGRSARERDLQPGDEAIVMVVDQEVILITATGDK